MSNITWDPYTKSQYLRASFLSKKLAHAYMRFENLMDIQVEG